MMARNKQMDSRRNAILPMAINASEQLFRSLFREILESDEEEELVEAFLLEAHLRLRGASRKAIRIEGYVEEIIPRFNTKQFREHYRMLPSTFELLENRLGPILAGDPINKPCIPVRTQLLATLWLLATPDSFRSVGLKHNLAKSSLNVSVQRVVAALNDMAGIVIRWPEGNCLDVVKQKFQCLSNMPIVIGAIDGCDISIDAPKAQKHFNSVLSRTRQVIERCFALLKGRFRRLKHLYMKRPDLIPSFILACCTIFVYMGLKRTTM